MNMQALTAEQIQELEYVATLSDTVCVHKSQIRALISEVLHGRRTSAYLAECQLATLEDMRMRSRVAKSRIKRQEKIARLAVEACAKDGIDYSRHPYQSPRLAKILAADEILI